MRESGSIDMSNCVKTSNQNAKSHLKDQKNNLCIDNFFVPDVDISDQYLESNVCSNPKLVKTNFALSNRVAK